MPGCDLADIQNFGRIATEVKHQFKCPTTDCGLSKFLISPLQQNENKEKWK